MKIRLAIVALVAVAGLSACGGESEDKASSDPTPTSSASVTPTPTADTGAELCSALTESLARMAQFGNAVSDPVAAGRTATQVVDALGRVKDAPADIQAAAESVGTAFESGIKPDGTFDLAKLTEIAGPGQTGGQAISAYTEKNC